MLELMEDVQRETWDETSEERTVRVVRAAPPRLLITMVWFGLVSGWLSRRSRGATSRRSACLHRNAQNEPPRRVDDTRGRLLIFALLGLLVTALGYWLPGLVRWVRCALAVGA